MPIFDVNGKFTTANVSSNVEIKASSVGLGIRSWVSLSMLYLLNFNKADVVIDFCKDSSNRDSKSEIRILF